MKNLNLENLINRANNKDSAITTVKMSELVDYAYIADVDPENKFFHLVKYKNKYVGIVQLIDYPKDLHIFILKDYRKRGLAYKALKEDVFPHLLHDIGRFHISAISKAGEALMGKFSSLDPNYKDYAVYDFMFRDFSDEEFHNIEVEMSRKLNISSLKEVGPYHWWEQES